MPVSAALIELAIYAIENGPALVKAGVDETKFVAKAVSALRAGHPPTAADWEALKALENPLRDELNAPDDEA